MHIDTSDLTLDESIDAVCAAIRTRFGVDDQQAKLDELEKMVEEMTKR